MAWGWLESLGNRNQRNDTKPENQAPSIALLKDSGYKELPFSHLTCNKFNEQFQSPHSNALGVERECHPNSPLIGTLLKDRDYIEAHFESKVDANGLIELLPRLPHLQHYPSCQLCIPERWIFDGSEYNQNITKLFAEKDGCIPSSTNLAWAKFIVPWRYHNKISKNVHWRIHHLHRDQIKSSQNETIVVNPWKDSKLRSLIVYCQDSIHKYKSEKEASCNNSIDLVDFLMKLVRDTLGDYGSLGGQTASDSDSHIYHLMLKQNSNFLLLGHVKIGVCRHKALLFKILCDVIDLECALITGYSNSGRHQWCIITLPDKGDYLIDPTAKHFTWTQSGSLRTKGYRVNMDNSLGHAGFTQKIKGII